MGKSSKSVAGQVGGAWTEKDIAAYAAELMGAPTAQAKAIPHAIALEQGLMPLLQSHYFNTTGAAARGVQDLYSGLEQGSISSQGRYGNALLGLYGNMGANATAQARSSMTGDVQNIYDTFTRTANEDLALGTSLNSQETQIAQGAARAAAQARGLQFSRQGGDLEILNTYNMGQQRLNQRRQVAGQAYQMGRDLQGYGAQAYLQPAMQGAQIYSIPGLVAGAEGAIGSYGPRTLQPESQYMANIRASRLQAQAAADQANATRSAGIFSGIATLGAAAMMAPIGTFTCWVAREVYGKDNPKWLVFREWLMTSSPDWFYNLYIEHGEEFAKFISDKPLLKLLVRKTMDMLISREEKKLSLAIYG